MPPRSPAAICMSATTLMSTATPGMHALTEAQNGLWYAPVSYTHLTLPTKA